MPRIEQLQTEDIARHGVLKATPARTTTPSSATPLPATFLEAARTRLAGAALLYASGYFGAMFFGTLAYFLVTGKLMFGRSYVVAGIFIAAALVIYFLARSGRIAARKLHAYGLAYGVVGSLGIGIGVYSAPETAMQPWGISWVCVWIMAFPLVVPGTPRQASRVAFASATAGAVAVFFWPLFFGSPLPPTNVLVATWYPNFVCAGLACLVARIIYRMGRDLERARQLGSYELVELLGKGGMGEVWRARHEMLARPAAIKLVRPEFLGDGTQAANLLRRFEREAQATATLTSPHSIELYDFGVTRTGTFYYVMEFLDGLDLESLVQRFGPLLTARVLHFLRQACHSLADAHHHGLIHRDIKPANMYACRMGLEHDFLKILDFGLVKPQRTASAPESNLTDQTLVTGTPATMAPEMVLGRDVDARADLYSLGCVGYWLLTGQLVFEAKTSMEMLVHHARTVPVPPSQRAELAIPPAVDALVLWCLEKEPARRPASAVALGEHLAALAGAAPWSPEQARQWWDVHAARPGLLS